MDDLASEIRDAGQGDDDSREQTFNVRDNHMRNAHISSEINNEVGGQIFAQDSDDSLARDLIY